MNNVSMAQETMNIEEVLKRREVLVMLKEERPQDILVLIELAKACQQCGEESAAMEQLFYAHELFCDTKQTLSDETIDSLYVMLSQLLCKLRSQQEAEKVLSDARRCIGRVHPLLEMMYAELLAMLTHYREAYAVLENLWSTNAESFPPRICLLYAQIARFCNLHDQVLIITAEYIRRYGIDVDIVQLQSIAFLHKKQPVKYLLSELLEFDWQRYCGKIVIDAVQSECKKLITQHLDAVKDTDALDLCNRIIPIITSYFAEEYVLIEDEFFEQTQSVEHVYWDFIVQCVRLRKNPEKEESYQRYISLESTCHGFPGFYYHLWQGMKDRGQGYCFRSAHRLLEKTIALTDYSDFSQKAKTELCRLLGIDSKDAYKLLTPNEVEKICALLHPESFDGINLLLSALELPVSVYTAYVMQALWALSEQQELVEPILHSLSKFPQDIHTIIHPMLRVQE